MIFRTNLLVAIFVGIASTGMCQDTKPADINQLRLYVPVSEIEDRFGENIEPVAEYIKALEKRASEILAIEEKPKAKGLLVAVGIKSKMTTRVWCQAVEGDVPEALLQKLETELTKIEAVDLRKGPAGFAIEFNLFGQRPEKFPEYPQSWLDAAKKSETKRLLPPDDLFKIIWPEGLEPMTQVSTVPSGFELQPLVLGGEILKPIGWKYETREEGKTLVTKIWEPLPDDEAKFDNGVTIDVVTNIADTKQLPSKFAARYVKSLEQQGKVIETFEPKTIYGLQRFGLLIDQKMNITGSEKEYRIRYCLFADDKNELLYVVTCGALATDWEKYDPTFKTMTDALKLIDLSKEEKPKQ